MGRGRPAAKAPTVSVTPFQRGGEKMGAEGRESGRSFKSEGEEWFLHITGRLSNNRDRLLRRGTVRELGAG